MRHREIDLQNPAEGNLLGIESDLHGFGMAGGFGARPWDRWRCPGAAGIARHDLGDAFDMFEQALLAPEAAARQDRGFAGGAAGRIERGAGMLCRDPRLRRARKPQANGSGRRQGGSISW